jgi:hypothetical protein
MKRRAFLQAVGGSLLAAPLAAGAQQVGKVYRIGYLGVSPQTPQRPTSGMPSSRACEITVMWKERTS